MCVTLFFLNKASIPPDNVPATFRLRPTILSRSKVRLSNWKPSSARVLPYGTVQFCVSKEALGWMHPNSGKFLPNACLRRSHESPRLSCASQQRTLLGLLQLLQHQTIDYSFRMLLSDNQANGVFQVLAEGREPLRPKSAVHDAMVAGEVHIHSRTNSQLTVLHNRDILDGSNGENDRSRRVDDGCE